MSIEHEDCRSARGGFSRCWGFQIVCAVCPTRGPHAPVGETLAAPESGATWAKRARNTAKEKQPGAQPDCFQIRLGYRSTIYPCIQVPSSLVRNSISRYPSAVQYFA